MKVITVGHAKFGEQSTTRFYRYNASFGPKTTAAVVALIKNRGETVLQCEKTYISCTGIIIVDKV